MCLYCVSSRMELSLQRLIVGLMVWRAAIQLPHKLPVRSTRGQWRGGIVFFVHFKWLPHTIQEQQTLYDLCLYFKYISLSFDPVFQLFRTGTWRIHTMAWLHHQICFLCYHAVAQLQSSAQRLSLIQSNRGEPNPKRHRGGRLSPALISAGIKKATVGLAMLSHRVSF